MCPIGTRAASFARPVVTPSRAPSSAIAHREQRPPAEWPGTLESVGRVDLLVNNAGVIRNV
ncbi:hypothetical protein GCM10017786_67380 [Amycolatopsis deserti]|uniref:SDR family NAD(P)-dependent oxidoreductase n=1 Tax=Amycolatopsis deserti TaxID=185696 RepID=A0ABQ3JHK9_9PSEU|nr:hypothetical protein GCM10017786_67380 [Amycolatopsis deserti]